MTRPGNAGRPPSPQDPTAAGGTGGSAGAGASRPPAPARRRPSVGGGLRAVGAAYRQAFSGLPREVWLLSVAILVHRSGTMVLPFLALYLTGLLGVSVEMAGLGLGVWGLGAVVGTYLGGRLTDRFGSLAVQAGSLLTGGAGFLVLGHLDSAASLFAGLFVTASLVDAFRPANAVALAEHSPPRVRVRAYALRRQAINLGMTLGPVAGGFLARVDYGWLFVADGVTCLVAAVLLVLFFRGRPAVEYEEEKAGGAAAVPERLPGKDGPFLVFLVLVAVLTAVAFQFLSALPLALRDSYGLDEARIGMVFAVNTLLILLLEMILMDRLAMVPPLKLVAWGALATGIGYGLVPFGSSFAFAALAMVVVTVGEMLSMPPAEAFVAGRAGVASRGRYMGLYNVSFAVALTAGPALGTWVYGRLGSTTLWIGCAMVGVALWFACQGLARRVGRRGDSAGGA